MTKSVSQKNTQNDGEIAMETAIASLEQSQPLDALQRFPAVVVSAIKGMADSKIRQPEKEGKWSILEVLQHLADLELIFGYRVRMILAHPEPPIQGMDPDLWAKHLKYATTANLVPSLDQLIFLRKMNLRLYHSLAEEQWKRVGIHSERGRESVEDIVRFQAKHDLTHLRQIQRIKTVVLAKG